MPSVSDIKALTELGVLTVAAFAFIGLAIWAFVKFPPIISNNTKAIEALTAAITPMKDSQEDACDLLEKINEKVATRDDLNRVHQRLDEQGGDIKTLLGKVGA